MGLTYSCLKQFLPLLSHESIEHRVMWGVMCCLWQLSGRSGTALRVVSVADITNQLPLLAKPERVPESIATENHEYLKANI